MPALPHSTKRDILTGAMSIVVAAVSAFGAYDEKARVVSILTIFAGGMGAGASLFAIVHGIRTRGDGAPPGNL